MVGHLACPVDRQPLEDCGDWLRCCEDHRYEVVDGIPVLLVDALEPTHPYCAETLRRVASGDAAAGGADLAPSPCEVDPFVQQEIVRTNGHLYQSLLGRLPRYPIPEFRFGPGDGQLLLDVGSNWGRWTFSAARAGFRAVGLDPWIDASLAAQRVARQLGHDVAFVVGDARRLPFRDGVFDAAFSYSVLQHFDKGVARTAIAEMSRVTRPGGSVIVQMPNVFGLRQAFNFARQRLRGDANRFRVRYWRPAELRSVFEEAVGPTKLTVDGFFSLNAQAADLDLLPSFEACLVRGSEGLRWAAERFPPLLGVADSLYVTSENRRGRAPAGRAGGQGSHE
jgi:SAM-dependent methyltransferase/uncharacterized protein YbaR (Trm112 family)